MLTFCSEAPSSTPSLSPTTNPTFSPVPSPTTNPSKSPTNSPSIQPTINPTLSPTEICQGLELKGGPSDFNQIYHRLNPKDYVKPISIANDKNPKCRGRYSEWESRMPSHELAHLIYFKGVCMLNGTWVVESLFRSSFILRDFV